MSYSSGTGRWVSQLKYLLHHCKIYILLILLGSDPQGIVSEITMYTPSQKRVSEITLDNRGDESWLQGNEGLDLVDRSTVFRGSWWGVLLYAFQNNAGYLLSLTFLPLLEIRKIQNQLLGTKQDKRREKSYSSTREVTLQIFYVVWTIWEWTIWKYTEGLCSCTFVASEKNGNSPRLLQRVTFLGFCKCLGEGGRQINCSYNWIFSSFECLWQNRQTNKQKQNSDL